MEKFIAYQRKLYPLSDESVDILLQHMEKIVLRKGEQLIHESQRNDYAYFILEGFARVYVNRGEKDLTLWFAAAGEMLCDGQKKVSSLNAEVMEDSILMKISQPQLDRLFEQSLELANWGRKLVEHYLSEYERYFADYTCTDAKAQYERLLQEYPGLFQKVPLKHIASYLQITPQSFSRIRAGKNYKNGNR